MRKTVFFKILSAVMITTFIMASSAFAAPWKFGVISDTQWTKADDGKNPNTCAADIIKQVNQQFIASGVKLVVAVGDMVDTGSQINDYTRALYAQDLYNAGIGFYPLRGNHEAAHGTYTGSSADYIHAYPQIVPGPNAGVNNNTPDDITTALIPSADLALNPPADKVKSKTFKVGKNFSAPDTVNASTGGVSYAFDYSNATFVLLDQFRSPDYYTSYISDQQTWIDDTLSNRPAKTHAFVFTHKNILGGNHKDSMFGGAANGSDPGDGYGIATDTQIPYADYLGNYITVGDKQGYENVFLASMQTNDVKYVISGHDHHHYNSVVTSPDGMSQVHQLITQSDSSKFYTQALPVSPNDMPVEQELNEVGYYIFTVDGPRVTIDYFADNHGDWSGTGTTPTLNFAKRSTTGYSLNGKENHIAQGDSYAMTDNTKLAATMGSGFMGTSMAILDGTNDSNDTTNYGKATVKAVNTGWAPAQKGMVSDILTLWGMEDLGADQTDTYVLSMNINKQAVSKSQGSSCFSISTRDSNGKWVNAISMNFGGTKKFVNGPWISGYALGTYGFDTSTNTAWVVINYNGDFAVSSGNDSCNGHKSKHK